MNCRVHFWDLRGVAAIVVPLHTPPCSFEIMGEYAESPADSLNPVLDVVEDLSVARDIARRFEQLESQVCFCLIEENILCSYMHWSMELQSMFFSTFSTCSQLYFALHLKFVRLSI